MIVLLLEPRIFYNKYLYNPWLDISRRIALVGTVTADCAEITAAVKEFLERLWSAEWMGNY